MLDSVPLVILRMWRSGCDMADRWTWAAFAKPWRFWSQRVGTVEIVTESNFTAGAEPSPRVLRAYIDESYRGMGDGHGVYLFAATLLWSDAEEDVRETLRRALPGRMHRFHWRNDRRTVRQQAVTTVLGLGVPHIVVFQVEIDRRRQERARQHAQWQLTIDLVSRGVSELVYEARERKQDEKDQRTIMAIRKAEVVPPTTGFRFARPLDEPLLWIPDIVLGMVGSAKAQPTEAHWFAEALAELDIIEVPLGDPP